MNVLSLFDGISVARVALDLAHIQVKNYYASEIEKNAISISKKNYPTIVRFGSVIDLSANMIPEPIDLLIGGSPCQDLSIAKKDRKGLEGERSGLFWEFVRIMNEVKPKYFILENVASMPQKDKDIITGIMGCEPIMFNASLVSAQCRKRLFWTNIKFELPLDRQIILKDILQPPAEIDERMVNKDKKAYTLTTAYLGGNLKNSVERKQRTMVKVGHIGEIKEGKNHANEQGGQAHRVYDNTGVSPTLGTTPPNICLNQDYNFRKLTPIECERLQSLPDNYTEGIAMTNRYKCLGNAFNAEVIAHILKGI